MSTRVFRQVITLAANQVIQNVLQGTDFDYPPGPSTVTVAAAATAGDNVDLNVNFGSRRVAENNRIATERVAGGGPEIPENVVVSDNVAPTERIQVGVTEQGGAAATPVLYVEVNSPFN